MKWFWGIATAIDLILLGATMARAEDADWRYLLQRVLWVAVSAVMFWNITGGVKSPWDNS